jgi:L-ascorbate metabolism protein UlaG (beta-lactamase superfamily)
MSRPKSDHFDGKIFFNPHQFQKRGLKDVLKWRMTSQKAKWPESLPAIDTRQLELQVSKELIETECQITPLGHITCLIRFKDLNILTDPVFSNRASPVQWAGPLRVRPPALPLEKLPRIDVVLVSHNHYDHMDLNSIAFLEQKFAPLFIVPLENRKYLESAGAMNITQLDWWQKIDLPLAPYSVACVPAQHWSSRTMTDRDVALWSGFVISKKGFKVYFAGDTGYGPHFKEIHDRFGAMNVSLLPIGAYEPRWFMKDQHMNPDDAVMAHIDLQSELSIATHFGTFQLTDEAIDAPVKELAIALEKRNISKEKFVALEHGASISSCAQK